MYFQLCHHLNKILQSIIVTSKTLTVSSFLSYKKAFVIGLGENNTSRLPHQQNCILLYNFKDSFLGCRKDLATSIDDYAEDGGEELFTKMHCVL